MQHWFVRYALVAFYPAIDRLPGLAACDLDAFLRRFRRETTRLMWLGVFLGACAFQLTPFLTVYVPLPACLLPAQLRDRHSQRMATSRVYALRQLAILLKLTAGLCWGSDPRVRAALDLSPYPPDPGTWRER